MKSGDAGKLYAELEHQGKKAQVEVVRLSYEGNHRIMVAVPSALGSVLVLMVVATVVNYKFKVYILLFVRRHLGKHDKGLNNVSWNCWLVVNRKCS